MPKILVAGLINIETTLRVDAFPVAYGPQHFPFWGVSTTVSGVGYNVARALRTLGHEVTLLTMLAPDPGGQLALAAVTAAGIDASHVLTTMPQTPQAVILYDGAGRRAAYTDLKDVQERVYPLAAFEAAAAPCDLLVLCNTNFTRPFLPVARRAGKLVATDVHGIADLEDAFNQDFMAAADILFMSHERLPMAPADWARAVMSRYGPQILVIGLGSDGALLAVKQDGCISHVPAVATRPVVNTIGAGDALFSAFNHAYLQTRDPYAALRTATVFASWKIGVSGGAEGLLTAEELAAAAVHLH